MGTRVIRCTSVVLALALGACGSDGAEADRGAGPRTADAPGAPATAGPPTGSGTAAVAMVDPVAPSSAPAAPVTRTLAFGGDLLTHMPVNAAAARHGERSGLAYDFGPMFAPLAPVLADVDLSLCHLEVPIAAPGQEITGYPLFRAPPEIATAIRDVGYDGCSTSSNHSLDGGTPAVDATLETFDLLGLGHVGTARSPDEDVAPRLYRLDGIVVGHLSYSYGFNGLRPPEDEPWRADAIDPAVIARDAAATRAAGAHLVVVSLHWGTEYRHEPDAYQRDTAAAVTGIDDVDLIVGHHAHVVQPIEQVNDTWVVWGLGNQLSNQSQPERRDGLTVVVTIGGPAGGRLAVQAIEAVPTYVDLSTYEVLPTAATLARTDISPELRAELEASQARTAWMANLAGGEIPIRG